MLVLDRRIDEEVTITIPPSAVTQTIKIKVLHLTADAEAIKKFGKFAHLNFPKNTKGVRVR